MKKQILSLLAALLLVVGLVSATTVDIDFDVDSGDADVITSNTDAFSHFHGFGGWTGNMNVAEEGTYLDTNCLMQSTTGANLAFDGWQSLSGYTNNRVIFQSFASGGSALLNNRFDNSNYVVQLERVDTAKDFLFGADKYGIGWRMGIADETTGILSAETTAQLVGDTSGAFDSGQWFPTSTGYYGWGNPDGMNAPDPAGYYTPINTVSAVGSGTFIQTAFGSNSLQFNGFNAGSGNAILTANFAGGFGGVYSSIVN